MSSELACQEGSFFCVVSLESLHLAVVIVGDLGQLEHMTSSPRLFLKHCLFRSLPCLSQFGVTS